MSPQQQFPMFDPEIIKREMERLAAIMERRIAFFEEQRVGVSQQGVAEQKLLALDIARLEPSFSFYKGAITQLPGTAENVSMQDALKQKRDGVGRECKARCGLLSLEIEECQYQLAKTKIDLAEMDKRVLVPSSSAMM